MSIEALSTKPFSMGSSSITAPAAADCMDMSLEDLIKARRSAISEQKKHSPLKSNNSQAKKDNKKMNAVQKSIGNSKAKRNAKTAARRGLASNTKPDPRAVEREVYRQQRRSNANGGDGGVMRTRSSGKPRKSPRIRNNKTEAERRTKAKNLANERKKANEKKKTKQQNGNKAQQVTAPPRRAVSAAMKAMNTAGFTAPKGMKMVISFEPTEKKVNNQKKQNNTRKGQSGNNQRGNKR